MDDQLKQFAQEAHRVELSQTEKLRVREFLVAHMEKHPVQEQKTFLGGFMHFLKPVPITLAIVLCAGVGTSFAAESALPGDALYPIKIQVNENVRSFVAIGEASKAAWDTKVAERRLQEVEDILSENKAEPARMAQAEEQLGIVSNRLQQRIARLEESRRIEFAADISTRLETSLRVHAAVLQELSKKEEPAIRQEIDRVAKKVEVTMALAVETRERNERKIAKIFEELPIAPPISAQLNEKEPEIVPAIQATPAIAVVPDSIKDPVPDDKPVSVIPAASKVDPVRLPKNAVPAPLPIAATQPEAVPVAETSADQPAIAQPALSEPDQKELREKAEEVAKQADQSFQEIKKYIEENAGNVPEKVLKDAKNRLDELEGLLSKANALQSKDASAALQASLDARRSAKLILGALQASKKLKLEFDLPDSRKKNDEMDREDGKKDEKKSAENSNGSPVNLPIGESGKSSEVLNIPVIEQPIVEPSPQIQLQLDDTRGKENKLENGRDEEKEAREVKIDKKPSEIFLKSKKESFFEIPGKDF